jgi:large subunit ribosomal protein L9
MKVKIILNKDVPRVGHKGQVLEVALNYAQNVILSKNLGIIATPAMIKKLEETKNKKIIAKSIAADDADNRLSKIEKSGLCIKDRKVNDKGQLYAKITEKDIIENIFENFKFEISPKQILIPNKEINTKGEYTIQITLNQNNKIVKTYKVLLNVL